MSTVHWYPYKPLPGEEEKAFYDACGTIMRLQLDIDVYKQRLKEIKKYIIDELYLGDESYKREKETNGVIPGSDLPSEYIEIIIDMIEELGI